MDVTVPGTGLPAVCPESYTKWKPPSTCAPKAHTNTPSLPNSRMHSSTINGKKKTSQETDALIHQAKLNMPGRSLKSLLLDYSASI